MSNILDPRRTKLDAHELANKATQIPFHVTRKSYNEMETHCITEMGKSRSVWACKLGGARVHMKVVFMRIFDRATGEQVDYAPVGTLYCSGCDKPPQVKKDQVIFSEDIQTLAC